MRKIVTDNDSDDETVSEATEHISIIEAIRLITKSEDVLYPTWLRNLAVSC